MCVWLTEVYCLTCAFVSCCLLFVGLISNSVSCVVMMVAVKVTEMWGLFNFCVIVVVVYLDLYDMIGWYSID